MKVLEELDMSRRVVILLMKYNCVAHQASNIENVQFARECYANIVNSGDS